MAKKDVQKEPLEKKPWKTANKLRKNIDAAEYKHVTLGLIFFKYISDAFNELHPILVGGQEELFDKNYLTKYKPINEKL